MGWMRAAKCPKVCASPSRGWHSPKNRIQCLGPHLAVFSKGERGSAHLESQIADVAVAVARPLQASHLCREKARRRGPSSAPSCPGDPCRCAAFSSSALPCNPIVPTSPLPSSPAAPCRPPPISPRRRTSARSRARGRRRRGTRCPGTCPSTSVPSGRSTAAPCWTRPSGPCCASPVRDGRDLRAMPSRAR